MNITLKQLEVFLAVARYENLTQASAEVFLTKGAVSQALQELEKQLGVKLFDRVHPHIRLNHEGARLRPLADEIMQRSQEVEMIFRSGGSHFLNIGASKTIGTYILPELLEAFERKHHWLPNVHMANTNRLLELTAAFALDAVLLEGEIFDQNFVTEEWLVDEMVVLAHKGHSLADNIPHAPKALCDQRWILREPQSGTREFFEHSLGRLLSPYEVVQSLSSPEAILAMVEQGIGITFASKIITELPDFTTHLSMIHLTQSFSRTFSICYHSKKYHSASMDQFLQFCRQWTPRQARSSIDALHG